MKISIISDKPKQQMADMTAAADEQDALHDSEPALQSAGNGDTSTAASPSTSGSITNTLGRRNGIDCSPLKQ